jgi:spore maturation protein CgeB
MIEPTAQASYAGLRVLVLRESWIGNTGLSAFDAMVRLGVCASSIPEPDFIPIAWRSSLLRGVRRLVRPVAVAELNAALLAEARFFRPDLFLAVKGAFLRAETLRVLKRSGTTVYCYYPDVSMLAHGPYLPECLPEYDWIFTTKSFGPADLQSHFGITRSSYLPHAYDPRVHRPRAAIAPPLRQFECDISFVGSWSPKKELILSAVVARRPALNLKVWGAAWHRVRADSPLRPFLQLEIVPGALYAAVVSSSKINLGLLSEARSGASSGDRITSRTFHIPAVGGAMLHERTDDLLQYFVEGESCECFGDVDELVDKLDRLLADAPRRNRIAVAGQRVVEAAHSWDHRAATILDHLLQHRSVREP